MCLSNRILINCLEKFVYYFTSLEVKMVVYKFGHYRSLEVKVVVLVFHSSENYLSIWSRGQKSREEWFLKIDGKTRSMLGYQWQVTVHPQVRKKLPKLGQVHKSLRIFNYRTPSLEKGMSEPLQLTLPSLPNYCLL